ncbi:MAG TPA: hypothetical protein VM029_02510, partial [Opitutaceae bacterium]|nr:hypothetical protein [Opitutaceae bacterium]
MKAKLIKDCGLAATLFVACFSWSAAADSPAATVATNAPAAKELQRTREQLTARSELFLAERQKMIDQLRTATEEQKKAILAKMEEQRQAMLEASRELAKQAREDLR